ncbi:MAG: RNA ligase family protein [bacterium]|nr:RNA ligase family protein [bacterium]
MNLWKNRSFTPMLLKEIDKPFNSKKYYYELKYDGYRALIFVNKNEIYIQSRNKNDITYLYPELSNIKKIVNKNVIFDGEIVIFENNKPSFNKISKRSKLKSKNIIQKESINNPVIFIAFDILYENKDLTNLPLIERKKILEKYHDTDFFIKSKVYLNNGIKLYNFVKKNNLEGIVIKDINGLYHINNRTSDFIKVKNIKSDNFFIAGYINNNKYTSSLILCEKYNNDYIYVGKVLISKKNNIYEKILNIKKCKNYLKIENNDITFIKPILSCKINYLERTKNGHLRHPKLISNE